MAVSNQGAKFPARFQVPQMRETVRGTGDKTAAAIRGKAQGFSFSRMVKGLHQHARGGIINPDMTVIVAGNDPGAVWRNRAGADQPGFLVRLPERQPGL